MEPNRPFEPLGVVEEVPFDPDEHADLLPPEDHHLQDEISDRVPFVPATEVPSLPTAGDGNG